MDIHRFALCKVAAVFDSFSRVFIMTTVFWERIFTFNKCSKNFRVLNSSLLT